MNVHGYRDEQGNGVHRATELHHDAHVRGGKSLWLSEYGGEDADGLTMARHLLSELHLLRPSAWMYWQPLDEAGWGLIDANIDNKTIGQINPKFFVLAQFTRHIRPAMVMLGGSAETAAAYDEENQKLVVVALNDGNKPRRTRFNLAGFRFGCEELGSAATVRKVSVWKTNRVERYQHAVLSMRGMEIVASMAEKEVITVEIKGLYLEDNSGRDALPTTRDLEAP